MLTGLRLGALHFGVASGAMLLAFLSCEGIHEVTHLWLHHVMPHMHAVFLPFGVLILLGWVYGWLMVPLALPAALLSAYWAVGSGGMTGAIVAITAAKVLSVPLAFSMFRVMGQDVRGEGGAANWRCVVMVGLFASVLGNLPRAVLGPLGADTVAEAARAMLTATSADMAGLIFVMLVAMLFFRLARHA